MRAGAPLTERPQIALGGRPRRSLEMTERWCTPAALRERIRLVVAAAGSQDVSAKRLGISPQYLCDVLKGRREPGTKLLDALGYRRVVMYEQVRRSRPPSSSPIARAGP
jgi:hypothetical protein